MIMATVRPLHTLDFALTGQPWHVMASPEVYPQWILRNGVLKDDSARLRDLQ